jgi:hypothetical protein
MGWTRIRSAPARRSLVKSENATMAVIMVILCVFDIVIAWLLLAK